MSNLLSQASLVMIPSGYKEDVVYSQIPLDGSGDLQLTRASNGTRVNSAGLVEVCPWNLVSYSEDQTQWTSENATTVTANSTTAPNGTLTADTVTPTAVNDDHYRGIVLSSQVGELTAFIYVKPNGYNFFDWGIWNGSSYIVRATFDLVNLTYTFTNAGTATIESVGNGWLKCGISGSNASLSTIDLYYRVRPTGGAGAFTGNGTSGAFIWGAQLNIGSTAKPYFPTTDRLNVPRLTYQNGGGGCPSLLLEPQRTNLALYSEQFDNASWTQSMTSTTANQTTSPDGNTNADLINALTGTGQHFISTASINFTSGVAYTMSVFAKKGNTPLIQLFGASGIYGSNVWATYNFDTLEVTTGSAATASMVDYENGWYRLILTGTSISTSLASAFYAAFTNDKSVRLPSFTAANQTFYLWGAQLEASSYPTSYIPTTSSSATRVADACYKTGISSLFGTNQGTFFIDLVYYGSKQFCYLFDVTDSANANRFLMYDSNGSGLFVFYNSTYGGISTIQLTKGQRYKIAVKYNSSGTIWYVNGVLSATEAISFAYQMSQIYLGIRYSISDNSNIQVNETIVFPTALTSTELASLTTI